jgi:hypothetical protein
MERTKTCDICGKVYQGSNAGKALAGHVWLKHHKRIGLRHELEARIVGLEARIVGLEKELSQCRTRIPALERQLAITELELENEKMMLKPVANGNYCPKCGKLMSDHEVRHDLAWGDKYLCPSKKQ